MKRKLELCSSVFPILSVSLLFPVFSQPVTQPCQPGNTIQASVVALDQPFMWNRLGTAQPQGMMFALESDVVSSETPAQPLSAGKVRLRDGKRPRPMVLRVNVGSCLKITFTNLLAPATPGYLQKSGKFDVSSRTASIHLTGLDLVDGINSDGSFVGNNSSALAQPGETKIYTYFAPAEGTYLTYSTGDLQNPGSNTQLVNGLFGSVHVEPPLAEYYRSQVTREQLNLASYQKDSLPRSMVLTPKMENGRQVQAVVRGSTFPKGGLDQTLGVFTLTTLTTLLQSSDATNVVLSPGEQRLYILNPLKPLDAPGTPQTAYPFLNYGALDSSCTPILKMVDFKYTLRGGQCVADRSQRLTYATDLTAMITGPMAAPFFGRFPKSLNSPSFDENPAEPDRRQPFREFSIHYHNPAPVQAFSPFFAPTDKFFTDRSKMLGAASDKFAINYGIAGIAAEVMANRLGVGPSGSPDAVELKFEEFFLTSWAVGDPAMVVDVPANAQNQIMSPPPSKVDGDKLAKELPAGPGNAAWTPTPPTPKDPATKAFYADDPSNVYHSYVDDHVKFRILHAGPGATHVHHLHAHQWLRSPNSDESSYLDSQMLTPGASYTLEIAYAGSGNRNQTVGDSIFHCHFYPHFASGMWSLWRVHDVFEAGTILGADGRPQSGINRVLPDGEIQAGTPIPAVVPLPTLAMAPVPSDVELDDAMTQGDHRRIKVIPDPNAGGKLTYSNPGFPFFVPGVAGHRSPHPPMDFAWKTKEDGTPEETAGGEKKYLDGGLPRHLVLGGRVFRQFMTPWDFTKDFVLYGDKCPTPGQKKCLADGDLKAFQLPELGTAVERAAMAAHAIRSHASFLPNGKPGNFLLNGLPPVPGAPFAQPGGTPTGQTKPERRRYKAANIQIDVALNKAGWHYPQQRMLALWDDVSPTVQGIRPTQPFFFRANSGESIEYWHTNLVPNYYEMDDFQVRTPTDIIGQHIHLVKFDVLASDGGSNGYNYEDGTFSPDEVRERIFAVNKNKGLFAFDDGPRQFFNPDPGKQQLLSVKKYTDEYQRADGSSTFGKPPAHQDWDGAQTTIQLWDSDELLNNKGVDRTLRTVFTHDHFGPSTHQQAGLYAGLLIEPQDSTWIDPITGKPLFDTESCYNPTTLSQVNANGACPAGSYRRTDGGPTSWQANIIQSKVEDSYREFALEFQDLQLAYVATSKSQPSLPTKQQLFTLPDDSILKALNAGTLAPGLISRFKNAGFPLGAKAIVKKASDLPCPAGWPSDWVIMDPGTVPGVNDVSYCLSVPKPNPAFNLAVYFPVPLTTFLLSAATIQKLSTGVITDDLTNSFLSAGISLTKGAKAKVSQRCPGMGQATNFVISDPNSPDNSETYCLSLSPTVANTYSLFLPNMEMGWSDKTNAIAPPASPVLVSNGQAGTYSLNYRNEPIPLRLGNGPKVTGPSSDPAFSYASIQRTDPNLGCQPTPFAQIGNPCGPASTANGFKYPNPLIPAGKTPPQANDPYTPLLRAYQGENVQIRTLVGAHLSFHSFNIPGVNWLREPGYDSSGHVSTQGMGLSEHYEMLFRLPPATTSTIPGGGRAADYVYQTDAGVDGTVNGVWGIMRAFDPSTPLPGLTPLPKQATTPVTAVPQVCPAGQPRKLSVVAVSASNAITGGAIPYNTRANLTDKNALLYVRSEDLNCGANGLNCTLKPGVPVEPLILRAKAGECIQMTLTNDLNGFPISAASAGLNGTPFTGALASYGNTPMGNTVGLVPSFLFRDANGAGGLGFNVGFNQTQTIAPQSSQTTTWFAGKPDGTPVEYGTIFLQPADPLLQHFNGLVGALVIEPAETQNIEEDANSHAYATITKKDGTSFRELVLVGQNDIENYGNFQAGFNYRTEPMNSLGSYRYPQNNSTASVRAAAVTAAPVAARPKPRRGQPAPPPPPPPPDPNSLESVLAEVQKKDGSVNLESLAAKGAEFSPARLRRNPQPLRSLVASIAASAPPTTLPPAAERYANSLVNGDPQTPILVAPAGIPVRIRLVFAGGTSTTPIVFNVHGHHWQEEPWTQQSTVLGFNRASQTFGAEQIVPNQVSNFLLEKAGGSQLVSGDYLYEAAQAQGEFGMWGLLRVQDTAIIITGASTTTVKGRVMVKPGTAIPSSVAITGAAQACPVQPDGSWSCAGAFTAGNAVTATTANGGSFTATVRND